MTQIRLIAFDVDGTLTAGGIDLDSAGNEEKTFNVRDGLGFRLAESVGISIAIISGRSSKAVQVRMSNLNPENILLGVGDKAEAFRSIQRRLNISKEESAFVGDDLNDLSAFREAGLKIAVSNAMPALKRQADHITTLGGGFGAAREAIQWILKHQNAYNSAVTKYIERELSNV